MCMGHNLEEYRFRSQGLIKCLIKVPIGGSVFIIVIDSIDGPSTIMRELRSENVAAKDGHRHMVARYRTSRASLEVESD